MVRLPSSNVTSADVLAAAVRGEIPPTHALVDLAIGHGVDALLGGTIHPDAPADVAERLRQGLAAHQALAALRDTELRRVLAAFATAGVAVLIFKGAHLRHCLYRAPGLRPSSDTDLLVAESDRGATVALLGATGYSAAVHVRGRLILGQMHFGRQDEHRLTHPLDVHWRLAAPLVFRHVLPMRELDALAMPIPVLGESARGPSWAHALLIACVHLVAHHRPDPLLLWLYDISALAARLDPPGWDVFVQTAVSARVTGVCAAALAAARRHFDHQALATAEARLCASANAHEDEPSRAALSVHGPIEELWLDLRAVEDWREGLTLLREHVYPEAGYMRERAGDDGWLPLLHARRLTRGIPRWIAATWSGRRAGPDESRADSAAGSDFHPGPGTSH